MKRHNKNNLKQYYLLHVYEVCTTKGTVTIYILKNNVKDHC